MSRMRHPSAAGRGKEHNDFWVKCRQSDLAASCSGYSPGSRHCRQPRRQAKACTPQRVVTGGSRLPKLHAIALGASGPGVLAWAPSEGFLVELMTMRHGHVNVMSGVQQ